jgi:phage tail tape-measure protein
MRPTDNRPDPTAAATDPRRQAHDDKPGPTAQGESSTGRQLASHPAGAIAGAAAGAAAGAVSGIAAGPVGSLAGAVVGGATGAVLGSGASSASSGQPVQPGAIDDQVEAAAPSIQPPAAAGTPQKRKPE